MMFQYCVVGLSVGATIILFDGSPLMPHAGVLFDLAKEVELDVFGASAKYYATLEKQGYTAPLIPTLRAVLSTGSPLLPQSFDYIHKKINADVMIGSITGGTDICSLFAGCIASEPVYRGQIQGVCLGIDMQVS
jgi:acetoacetyl-CoA synthetase